MIYTISLEKNGVRILVGQITGSNADNAEFQYLEEYLQKKDARPISVSLPLQTVSFSADKTRRFFEGLLPEGFTRRAVAQWMHSTEDDYLTILHGLGRECLGALQVTDDSDIPGAAYEKLTHEEVIRLAGEGAVKSAEIVVESHLSLTGASGKVGLYYNAKSDEWYLPKGTAPSTHIVKQSHVRLSSIVTNEQLSMLTAKKCGIETAGSFIINTGHGNDAEILLASERYDRTFSDMSEMIGHLPVPLRLHQEDLAQALGLSSAQKYEPIGGQYFQKVFALLRRVSADPITDRLKLWDMIIFHYLIGNTDNHVKNFSLLYSSDMRQIRLAPAYDIISTAIYPSCTRDMAFAIGGGKSLDSIDRTSFKRAAREAGIGEKLAMQHFDRIADSFENALHDSGKELMDKGFSQTGMICDSILRCGGYRKI